MDETNIPMDFDADEIGTRFEPLPTGKYRARFLDAQVSESKVPGQANSVLAMFQITTGDRVDEDVRIYYTMRVWPPKKEKGAWFAPGLMAMKADLVAVEGLPAGTRLSRDANESRKIYSRGMARKEVTLYVYEESYKDRATGEAKTVRKTKVIGLAGQSSADSSELDLV